MITFGVFDWIDRHPDLDAGQLYASRLALLEHAEGLGFDIYHLAEHHGTPLGLAGSPNVFLAAATRSTRRIRLNPLVHVLPLHHPVRLAEESAMLDHLSGGRLEIGVGKGSSPYEASYFGVQGSELDTVFAQRLEKLLQGLRDGVITLDDGQACRLAVTPLQRPHPPIWYPTVNAASIPRLAVEGMNTIFSFGFLTPPIEEIEVQCREYLRIAADRDWHGLTGAGAPEPRFGVLRHVYVGDSEQEAHATAIPALEAHYDNFVALWRQHGNPRHPATRDFSVLAREGKVIVGSSATVREQLLELLARTGINHFAGAFAFGSLAAERAAASMTRFANEVKPALRRSHDPARA